MDSLYEFNEETEPLLLANSSNVKKVNVVQNDFAQGNLATRLAAALEASEHVNGFIVNLARFDDLDEDPSDLPQFLQNGCHREN